MDNRKNFILIALLFIVSIVFIFVKFYQYNDWFEQREKNGYENNRVLVDTLIEQKRETIESLALVIANDKTVNRALLDKNPELLRDDLRQVYQKLKERETLLEMHFFTNENLSFVNFLMPKNEGKNISKIRPDLNIMLPNKLFSTPKAYYMTCGRYTGLRAIAPIINDNKTIGKLSIGVKLDWLTKEIKKITNLDTFLFFNNESLSSLTEDNHKNFMAERETISNYVLAYKTINFNLNGIDFTKKQQLVNIDNNEYLLNMYTIYDYANKELGKIAILEDFTQFKKSALVKLGTNFAFLGLIFALSLMLILIRNRKIKKTLKWLNSAQKIAKIGSYVYYKNKNYVEWSDEHYKIMGVKKDGYTPNVEGFLNFVHPEDKERIKKIIEESSKSGHSQIFNYKIITQDRKTKYVCSTLKVSQRDTTGDALIIEGTIQDISELSKLEAENRQKSCALIESLYIDNLTGLGSRSALLQAIGQTTALAILNIKSFRDINDVFGFEVGDFMLKNIAQSINKEAQKYGLELFRVGSDDFALLTKQEVSKDLFITIIEKIIKYIDNKTFTYKELDIKVSLYGGINFTPKNILEKVDIALNIAKKENKELVIYSDRQSSKERQKNNIIVVNKIKFALENNGVLAYFQPIVDKNMNCLKYEALIRINDNGDILTPYTFLEISKKTKYYPELTKNILKKSFDAFKYSNSIISINLSALDILNNETKKFIIDKLYEFEGKNRVVFELLESESIIESREILKFMKKVKQMGAKIAIDDFGTGYSNFSYMLELKPDFIKIDGSLIKNLDTNENSIKIVKSIVTFSHELNIKTVAEFVHSKEIFEICKELNIDEFQGYFIGEPKKEVQLDK